MNCIKHATLCMRHCACDIAHVRVMHATHHARQLALAACDNTRFRSSTFWGNVMSEHMIAVHVLVVVALADWARTWAGMRT